MTSGNFLRALGVLVLLGGPVAAQDLFSPAIVVNDRAVTGYELQQRALLLDAFGTPGDLPELARTQLVEERLKQQELDRAGATLSDEALARALADFASRAELSTEEFEARLATQGVDPETLRDYVATNVTWRDYIRARFGDRVEVTDPEVEQALSQQGTERQGIEVLLNEIVIPAPPGREAQAEAAARQISQITSVAEFEAAAREVSAVPSRERGGELDWTPLSNYPAVLQGIILELSPGEVTPPLPVTGAVALLQLRDVREAAVPAAQPELVDYAVVRIPGGLSQEAVSKAAGIAARADTCTDLFALGLPDQNIERQAVAPGSIPEDVALDLAKLDPNEATWGRTTDGGQTLLLTMLCSRTYPLPEGAPDREAVRNALRSQRLEAFSDALVADLRASATIVGE
ncbi:Survival protein SurA precursor (Peptidyl-prolyl cis-trans isomerase SurA) [Rubellimicrobium mesophilum DSM 19309]|uniref:Parvulin-like PPIase n=1 Tax=Rubellimicrobium mesophilum DSM 19309 TaxID=442562 RepID=A0A017HIZ4_9RHOB|nr:peptidylprolyl isomerase [Rubellimicrobium mesophilum]EYD74462.1 Survival protein SurA precursor (Peptidyl-prolyl cis-trans isomerase SurA) [Rubellimicrobium mesophilum DSM 19309]